MPRRRAQAIRPSERSAAGCTCIFVKIWRQNSAMWWSTTVAGIMPVFTISRMSSSSSASLASPMFTGGLPAARSEAFSARRCS